MKRAFLTLCIIVAVLFSSTAFAAYALTLNGQVVQVSDKTFPVHPSLQWVECRDEVKPGWVIHYVGVHGGTHVYEPPIVDAEPKQTIEEWRATAVVGPLQIRRALRETGDFNTVQAAMETADELTREAWQYAGEFRRNDPLVEAMRQVLGKTPEEVDELFRLAATK